MNATIMTESERERNRIMLALFRAKLARHTMMRQVSHKARDRKAYDARAARINEAYKLATGRL